MLEVMVDLHKQLNHQQQIHPLGFQWYKQKNYDKRNTKF